MPKMKVLIVDDQELILESLKIVLEMEDDIEVVGLAKNGEEAIDYCENFQPDIILMDINMPIMDGVVATEKIKPRFPLTKIIILTSYKEVEYVLAALSHGAEGFLLKAIHPKNLIAGIRVVHTGGTLISPEMADKMIKSMLKSGPELLEKNNEFGLSAREVEVLHKLALGLRNQDIAKALYLSEGTVKNYISNIYSKMNVKGRREAAYKARETGILDS
ncbi:two component transcriptional regulator, LuxR family [Paenibacillus curdlanolyticus YK9]|uniref:Two component transcriptional regulator, LuxR family n=1 Tax=Paenibacillus curdlanolyticus YK9 TaxID=717606 RepID=E0I9F1_9BACL|nr:response regulator transcription factor [Paenibacillus curdlanolyticus]EFM11035.1 two component transcriptional regulator, LuxR family [Paenibacillus curdlanolyticus YK9]